MRLQALTQRLAVNNFILNDATIWTLVLVALRISDWHAFIATFSRKTQQIWLWAAKETWAKCISERELGEWVFITLLEGLHLGFMTALTISQHAKRKHLTTINVLMAVQWLNTAIHCLESPVPWFKRSMTSFAGVSSFLPNFKRKIQCANSTNYFSLNALFCGKTDFSNIQILTASDMFTFDIFNVHKQTNVNCSSFSG